MSLLTREITIAKQKVSLTALLWFLLAAVAIIIQLSKGAAGIHNYLIFKGVFWHTIQQSNLYIGYRPDLDLNHYGPFFSFVIAPFALLPDMVGCLLWCVANAIFLFYAVRKLPVTYRQQNLILLVGGLEMMTSMHNVQFNPMVTAWIIFSYILVKNNKDFWATLFIAAGILTKLYGIVGLAFFLFSENKIRFVLSFLFWMILFFFLPMIISSPAFIIQTYKDWYASLSAKNTDNQESFMQGMSAMKIIRKVFMLKNLQDIHILGTAAVLYLLPLMRINNYKNLYFQLSYLSFLLIGVVIFSSSAESATYVIAMMGVGIWYSIQKSKNWWALALIIFAILLTSLSTTDLFPKSVKAAYIRPYGLKALPCFIIWIVLCAQLLFKKFSTKYQNLISPVL